MIPIDVLRLLRDFRVPHQLQEGRGWVSAHCPLCPGTPDFHLGYNLRNHYWNCFRCGGKSWEQVARALTGQGFEELRARYGGALQRSNLTPTPKTPRVLKARAELPLGCGPMGVSHHSYLYRRGFDSDQLEQGWGLLGTGPVGPDKLRVVAPIHQQGKLVSWQARYFALAFSVMSRACPPDREARPIKHCLYGLDQTNPDRGCVVVEGITDVWRLGAGAVATFGTEWSMEQARLLLCFSRVFVLFDSGEEAAQQFSSRLCMLLRSGGIPHVEQVSLGDSRIDPGDLLQADAEYLMWQLGLR